MKHQDYGAIIAVVEFGVGPMIQTNFIPLELLMMCYTLPRNSFHRHSLKTTKANSVCIH